MRLKNGVIEFAIGDELGVPIEFKLRKENVPLLKGKIEDERN